jgi:methionyl-tRNA formyltransferase
LIVRGHKETKISALKCVSDVDAGPIFLKRPLSLEGSAEVILRRASSIIEEMIAYIIVERPEPTPQVGEITKFSRRGPKDGDIEKCQSIEEVYDYIRMLDAVGYPSAFLDAERLRLEFSQAKLKEDYVEAVVRIRRKQHAS